MSAAASSKTCAWSSLDRREEQTVRRAGALRRPVRQLDQQRPEGTLIELSYEHLRENLTWKLFVPETGFINLPNLYFNEPGIYKIQLYNTHSHEKFYSAPIKCFPESDKNAYWGLLHAESDKYDATENIENCLRTFRDEKSLQFFASSPFEGADETSNDDWKSISAQIAEFNEDSRFTTFLGMQWCGDEPGEGLRQFIYLKDSKPIMRKKDSKTNLLKKIYKIHNPKELLAIPCFTMGKGVQTDFKDFAPELSASSKSTTPGDLPSAAPKKATSGRSSPPAKLASRRPMMDRSAALSIATAVLVLPPAATMTAASTALSLKATKCNTAPGSPRSSLPSRHAKPS